MEEEKYIYLIYKKIDNIISIPICCNNYINKINLIANKYNFKLINIIIVNLHKQEQYITEIEEDYEIEHYIIQNEKEENSYNHLCYTSFDIDNMIFDNRFKIINEKILAELN